MSCEHREKAVEALAKAAFVPPTSDELADMRLADMDAALQTADSHLKRMYFECLKEAVHRLAEDRSWVDDLRAGGIRREQALRRIAPEGRGCDEAGEWVTCPQCEGEGEVGMEWIGEKFVAGSGTRCPLCKGAMGFDDEADLSKAQELMEEGG